MLLHPLIILINYAMLVKWLLYVPICYIIAWTIAMKWLLYCKKANLKYDTNKNIHELENTHTINKLLVIFLQAAHV